MTPLRKKQKPPEKRGGRPVGDSNAVVLGGLTGFALAEVMKQGLHLKAGRSSWLKVAIAFFGSAVVAGVTHRENPQSAAIDAGAGFGLALLVHKLYRMVSARGDDLITDVISKRAR